MTGAARTAVSLAAGLLFGFGLALSGMLDPKRVLDFLDVTGAWDPTLAFVLAGAVTVSGFSHVLRRRMPRPVLSENFQIKAGDKIDGRLILGSAIFGVGWGLVGFCPGPALAALSLGLPEVFVFTIAMIVGMAAHDRLVDTSRWNEPRVMS